MFQKLAIFLVVFFATIIETSVFPNFMPSGTAPSIFLVLVIFWTIQEGFEKALLRTIMIGFFADLVYGWPIGINIITLVSISFSVSSIAKRFLLNHKTWRFFTMAAIIFFSAIANELMIVLFMKILSTFSLLEGWMYGRSLPIVDWRMIIKAFHTSVVFLILSLPLSRLGTLLAFYSKRAQGEKSFRAG